MSENSLATVWRYSRLNQSARIGCLTVSTRSIINIYTNQYSRSSCVSKRYSLREVGTYFFLLFKGVFSLSSGKLLLSGANNLNPSLKRSHSFSIKSSYLRPYELNKPLKSGIICSFLKDSGFTPKDSIRAGERLLPSRESFFSSVFRDFSKIIRTPHPIQFIGSIKPIFLPSNKQTHFDSRVSLFNRVFQGRVTETIDRFIFTKAGLDLIDGIDYNSEEVFLSIFKLFIKIRNEIQDRSDYGIEFFESDDYYYPSSEEGVYNWIQNIDISFYYRNRIIEGASFYDPEAVFIAGNFNERVLPKEEESND